MWEADKTVEGITQRETPTFANRIGCLNFDDGRNEERVYCCVVNVASPTLRERMPLPVSNTIGADGPMTNASEQVACMRAFREKHPQSANAFVVAIRTTGVFCKPTCRAKPPLDKNVEFFRTAQSAMFHGYRACKLCKPLAQSSATPSQTALVSRVLAMVEGSLHAPPLRERHLIAAGIDPSTARRSFVREVGMTVSQYQRAMRMGSAIAAIRNGASMTSAQNAAGFASESGFRSAAKQLLGSDVAEFASLPRLNTNRKRAVRASSDPASERTHESSASLLAGTWLSPLGEMVIVIAATSKHDASLVTFDWIDRKGLELELLRVRRRFGSHKNLATITPNAAHPLLEKAKEQMTQYFAGKRKEFDLPLAEIGTPFQRSVWAQLLTIPHGQTRSYAQQAKQIGNPSAVRAVATANGANYRSIVIPCHRVIGSDGSLTGYGGGVQRKEWLLGLERGGEGKQNRQIAKAQVGEHPLI
jgi:AraC family transcriptional regulator of adaptative response/methylated-DNA-[protein]-cysteine methyltransferase